MLKQEPHPIEVADLRKEAGLSAADFGALVYASAGAVNSWEAGRRGCPCATWELLLIYFGKAPARVAGGRGKPIKAQEAQQHIAAAMESLKAFRKAADKYLKETTR